MGKMVAYFMYRVFAVKIEFRARYIKIRIGLPNSKVGCVFPMVIVPILPHAEFG